MTYWFRCPTCSQVFELPTWKAALHPHVIGKGLYVRCPGCRGSSWIPPSRTPIAPGPWRPG